MGVVKGHKANNSANTKSVTVTETAQKTSLDVSVQGGSNSPGTGTGLSLEGSNALASGSILYGLEYKRIIKQVSPNAVTDVYNVYSDSAAANLITVLTIIYETASKNIISDAQRVDS